MKHISFFTPLLCLVSLILVSADKGGWKLDREYTQAAMIRSAYFDDSSQFITISTIKEGNIIDLQSSSKSGKEIKLSPSWQTFCFDQTNKFTILNSHKLFNNQISILYWPYEGKTKDHPSLYSFLPIAPHRCKLRMNPLPTQIVGITYEQNGGNYLKIQDIFHSKNNIECYHPRNIVDFCFHPHKNILASITSRPHATLFIWNTEKFHRFYDIEYPDLYSVRFDGDRLVVVAENTIDILDITDLGKIVKITSFDNTENNKQACLNGKHLAIATSMGIKLFDIETKKEIATFPGNNDSSPMNCFSPSGNLFMTFHDKKVSVYKKMEYDVSSQLSKALLGTITKVSSEDNDCIFLDRCDNTFCCGQLEKAIASICVFFQKTWCD